MPGWPGRPLSPLQTHLLSPGRQPLQVCGETLSTCGQWGSGPDWGGECEVTGWDYINNALLRDVILQGPVSVVSGFIIC